MTEEKPTIAGRILHLPFLILAGIIIFVIFLIVAVAEGIVAAAYEFGNAFRSFFGGYFEVPVIALVLIIAGIVLHLRKKSALSSGAIDKTNEVAPGIVDKKNNEASSSNEAHSSLGKEENPAQTKTPQAEEKDETVESETEDNSKDDTGK